MFANTETIILWSENKELIKYVTDVARELNVQIFVPDVIQDLLVTPGFISIIDSYRLKEIFSYSGRGTLMYEYFYYNDCKILVFGEIRINVTYPLSKNVEILPKIISKKLLLPIIKSNLKVAIEEYALRKNQFNKRIFRIFTLYHLIESVGDIDKEKLAFRFDKSIKTIDRDMSFLKKANPKVTYYIAKYNLNDKNKKTAISMRQIALQNQVNRLIDLYQLLKKGLSINVEKTCAKYEISERTVRRDIKLFKDVNPNRKISFDKVKGYY